MGVKKVKEKVLVMFERGMEEKNSLPSRTLPIPLSAAWATPLPRRFFQGFVKKKQKKRSFRQAGKNLTTNRHKWKNITAKSSFGSCFFLIFHARLFFHAFILDVCKIDIYSAI
jgi:hypothetical protein